MIKVKLFAVLAMFAICTSAFAIEIPKDAEVGLEKSPTAYSSSFKFNSLLESAGLKLDPKAVADVPSSYAKASDGKVMFNKDSIAYTPEQYHNILTAYGIKLSPEKVQSELGSVPSYAKVMDNKVVLGNTSVAYSKSEWETILSAYEKPMAPKPVVMKKKAPAPVVKAAPGDSDGDGVTDDKDDCPGTPRGIEVGERGCWALSNALLFDFDSAELKPEIFPVLDYTKEAFDAYPNMKVQVDGHTDSSGPEAYNQKLSERRAEAVMKYLVDSVGINPNRLTAVGYGESRPAYANDTEERKAKNRRVEFTPVQ
jgi:outer membrane protein OmpA-like peptidoglycan-associated protein